MVDARASRGSFDESWRRKLPFHSSADHVAHTSQHKPGFGLLTLQARCSYLPHLLFALLSGRMVVVLANPAAEHKVRQLITVLRLFVPGHSRREQVIPWRQQAAPLQLADLARIKLIGLSKQTGGGRGLPTNLRGAVSVLDFEKELLVTPRYDGAALDRLNTPKGSDTGMFWRSENLLLAHVHEMFMELASKAFLYFHTLCLGPGVVFGRNGFGAEGVGALTERVRAQRLLFMRQNSVKGSDAKIIEHLSEVIKAQHEDEWRRLRRRDGVNYSAGVGAGGTSRVTSIRLDHATCTRFANTKGPLIA